MLPSGEVPRVVKLGSQQIPRVVFHSILPTLKDFLGLFMTLQAFAQKNSQIHKLGIIKRTQRVSRLSAYHQFKGKTCGFYN